MFSYARWDHIETAVGRKLRVAGQESDCLHQSLSVRASFGTGDERRRSIAAAVDEAISQYFWRLTHLSFDLSTGARVPDRDRVGFVDLRIVDWVNQPEERWLHVEQL
jgi:hypothetical protein